MMTWLNSRVITVALSLAILVQISRHDGFPFDTRRAIAVCVALYLCYVLAFIVPLWKTFNFRRVVAPLLSLTMAWTTLTLALIADALPPEERGMRHNWPMYVFCAAAGVTFYFFFDNTRRGFRQRKELHGFSAEQLQP